MGAGLLAASKDIRILLLKRSKSNKRIRNPIILFSVTMSIQMTSTSQLSRITSLPSWTMDSKTNRICLAKPLLEISVTWTLSWIETPFRSLRSLSKNVPSKTSKRNLSNLGVRSCLMTLTRTKTMKLRKWLPLRRRKSKQLLDLGHSSNINLRMRTSLSLM